MKKFISLLSILLIISSCKNEKDTKKTTKPEVKVESKAKKVEDDHLSFELFKSDYDPKMTYRQLKDYLESKGMFFPKLVDHSTAANNFNIKIKPEYLVVFGNPKMGGMLMQENPEVGIELPLKVLIYQDEEKNTWVMYKNMDYLKKMFFLKDPNGVIAKMNELQSGFKKAVINPIKTTQITEDELE